MPPAIQDPNFQGRFGNTLLHGAVVSGDIDEVKRLLAAGAVLGQPEIEALLRGHVGGG